MVSGGGEVSEFERDAFKACEEHRQELLHQRDALKAALEEIVALPPGAMDRGDWLHIARQALREPEEK